MKTIKTIYTLLIAAMLPLFSPAEVKIATVSVNLTTKTVAMEVQYDTEARTAVLGNGHNACLPQYTAGRIVIPAEVYISGVRYAVTGINELAFRLCNALTRVDISEGVTTVGDFAFVGCSNLQEVSLPSTLTTVGGGAFVGLDKLTAVRSKAVTAPAWTWNDVFEYDGEVSTNLTRGRDLGRTLYVSQGATDSYRAKAFGDAIGWSDAFPRIYEMPDDDIFQEIGTLAELRQLRDYVNQGLIGDIGVYGGATNFRLTADITFDGTEQWTPIGTSEHPFEGTFDGGCHTISNLNVDMSFATEKNGGFFGNVDGATIYNIGFVSPVVVGMDNAGVLLGYCSTSVNVTDVMVVGDVTDGSDYTSMSINGVAGGIVGHAKQAKINRCYFVGSVGGKTYAGGVAGNIHYGSVSNSGAGGAVVLNASTGREGGVVGGSQKTSDEASSTLLIDRCYSWCTLSSTTSSYVFYSSIYDGGIIGASDHWASIANCYFYADNDDLEACNAMSYYHYSSNTQAVYDLTNMEDDKLQPNLGTADWYYFTEGYEYYPIPVTMSEWYLNRFVYLRLSDGNMPQYGKGFTVIPTHRGTEYKIVAYDGDYTDVTIPLYYWMKPVTEMADGVMQGNTAVESITFYAANSAGTGFSTGDYFAANCPNLTSVTLAGIDNLGEMNFYNCRSFATYSLAGGMESYTVSDGVLYRGNTLIHCPPARVDNSGRHAFTIPDGVTSVAPGAFAYSRLESITIGGDVETIGAGAFEGADDLRYIDATGADALATGTVVRRNDADNAFYGMNPLTLIFMPESAADDNSEPNVVIGDMANDMVLNEAWDFYSPVDITVVNSIQFTRTLTSDVAYTGDDTDMSGDEAKQLEEVALGYTVYQPYDVDLSESDNVTVYEPREVATVDGVTTITFVEKEDKRLDCYTPYYVVVDDGTVRLDADGPTMIFTSFIEFPTVVGGYEFTGTVEALDNAAAAARGAYILQSDNVWHKVPAGVEAARIPAYRAFFAATAANNAPARRLSMSLQGGGETTDVTVIHVIDHNGDDRYFDLNGRQLPGKPDSGIYIHRGAKHIAK